MLPLVALMMLAAATSFGYHRILLAQRDLIEHTYQVMAALETTLQLITDAETGQRGYILTRNPTYLKPYVQAIKAVKTQPMQLRQLVTDSPIQLARVDALEQALRQKLNELSSTLDVLDQQGAEAARKIVSSNVGREHMDRIRMLIAQMRQAETGLLIERSLRAARTERKMLVVTIALAVLSIFARVGLSFMAKRRLKNG
ncbi:CHASE3 domain-containing protein [Caballeronia sp. J97]|uniref:CHASE3 domain-containing protein n=1 Tax=Caballeronia sp. J97 TaxID=2805429 RepID=UPI002AB24D56|nr:CHASE3 domain-containing protein [Caballeronia sp. J97]